MALLSGCLDVTAAVQVSADDRITGTMVVTISREIAAQAGITSASDLAEQVAGTEIPEGLEVQTSQGEDSLAVTLSGDLSANDGLMVVTRSGQKQTFTVANQADPMQLGAGTAGGDHRIEVTADFAGTVTKLSGAGAQELDANTVRFSGPLLGQWRASATVDLARPVPAANDLVSASPVALPAEPARRGSPLTFLLVIGAVLVAALGATAHFVRRQSRRRG